MKNYRAIRHTVATLTVGLMSLGAAVGTAYAGNGNGNGNGKAAVCNYYYEWLGKFRFPLQPDPHATYTYIMPSNQAALDGIGFLTRGEFPHGVWTSWMAYTGKATPFDVANFINNPPANTNNPIVADKKSVQPFADGSLMQANPRNFTVLWVPSQYKGKINKTLDGTKYKNIDPRNIKKYPSPEDNINPEQPGEPANWWGLANRNYNRFTGFNYNPGGTYSDTFPVTTAVNLKTGEAVDCQAYNQLPDLLQRSPYDPPTELNYGKVPERIALKNGEFINGGLIGSDDGMQYGPTNPDGLVQFTLPKLLPGADVATIPPPNNCSGYLGTRTDVRKISLIRIPHVANYTKNEGINNSSVFPNPVKQPWEAAYTSVTLYGTSSQFYLPGEPESASLSGSEMKPDSTGGSTIVVWPRNLERDPIAKRRLVKYAEEQGWAMLRGGTEGPAASANILIRVKGSASDYFGRLANTPCYFDKPGTETQSWADVPVGRNSKWVADFGNLGPAAPQGVTCKSVQDVTSGRCVKRLKDRIEETGGSYYADE